MSQVKVPQISTILKDLTIGTSRYRMARLRENGENRLRVVCALCTPFKYNLNHLVDLRHLSLRRMERVRKIIEGLENISSIITYVGRQSACASAGRKHI